KCHPTYSLACESMFETNPARKPIYEVLKLKPEQIDDFKGWAETLFQEPIPFKDLALFGPQQFFGTHQRHIKIDYHPMRDDQGAVVGIVLVGTDKTQEILAGQEAERNKAYANMILKLSKNRGQFLTFIQEAQQMVHDLKVEVSKNTDAPNLDYIFRVMHTMKGCAAVFSISEIQELAHKYESRLQELKELSAAGHKVPVPELVEYSDHIEGALNRFLAENKTLIGEAGLAGERAIEVSVKKLRDFSETHLAKEGLAKEAFEKAFLEEPIEQFFAHVDEIVGPIASRQGKEIFPVKIVGGDLRINSHPYGELFQVLVHAFRNAVDHGLEIPERRVEAAKEPRGQITLEFAKRERQGRLGLMIKVIDDGYGIDPDVIRQKLEAKSPASSFQSESDEQVIYHIFDSGFSTRDEVTDISGRGIGMDAIRAVVVEMGGVIDLKSQVRIGTELTIWVPDQGREAKPVEQLRSA
ncbi:MAG: Hpt domain-containing protein, partial [Bdellovibrionales bacterium]|nr:Hpt domain-containing protein [Bdellovibrionales bacterium]